MTLKAYVTKRKDTRGLAESVSAVPDETKPLHAHGVSAHNFVLSEGDEA